LGIKLIEEISLSLYIHIPWCVRKCLYCDFNSYETRASLPEKEYIDALLIDLEQDLPRVLGRSIYSIFLGGGTPSLFSVEELDRLISGLRSRLQLTTDLEVTMEANPGTIERGKLAELRSMGINRLSIGIQSFNDNKLRKLGRIHSGCDAFNTAECAHFAGLENFNIDLMFGIPEQTVAQAVDDIKTAISLQPAHISYYQLDIEPNTAFHHAPPNLPDSDTVANIQQRVNEELVRYGYRRYEVAAYAREDRQCRHNINYWEFGDYLGIGAGAHGKLTDFLDDNIYRIRKIKHPKVYLKRAGTPTSIGGTDVISSAELPLEFMMNALRLVEGVPTGLFSERTGLPVEKLEPALSRLRERGLLVLNQERLQPTELGLLFLNDLLQEFLY
jgi:oxygen-independent coproporphyrinogen-3 oxidase